MTFCGDVKEAVSRYFGTVGNRPNSKRGMDGAAIPTASPDPEDSLIDPDDILAHNILSNSANRHGAGGLEIIAARVIDRAGRDTMQVEMLQSLAFHLLLRANEEIIEPSAGIHLFDRLGNVVFAAGTRQLGERLPDLAPKDELIVKMEIKFNVQPGEYTFSLGASEPSADQDPNVGYIHDRHELLGPIVVIADPTRIFPFYGIAQLPMKVKHYRVKKLYIGANS